MFKIFLIVFFISIYTNLIFSQAPPYYHYTSSSGLSSSTVYDILQDRNGFIWIATLNGLNRFDSKRFITYKIKDELNSNLITSLTVANNGELFIGNHLSGINVLRNGKIENYRKTIHGKVYAIQYLLNTQKKLYAYSSFGAIIEINKNDYHGNDDNLLFTNLLHKSILNRLVKIEDSKIIALTSEGLQIIKNRKLEKLDIDGLPEENFNCGALDTDGSILIGGDDVIYRIKNNKVIASLPIKIFDKNSVFHLFIDSHRNIWFSIFGKGFFVIPFGSNAKSSIGGMNSTRIVNIGKTMELENAQIDKFFEDNEGNMWIATYGDGVYCLTNFYIQNFSQRDGLTNNNINCILKDKSGKILLGTINGINVLENGIISQVKYNYGELITGYVNNFIQTKNYIAVSLTSEAAKSNEVFYKGLKLRLFRNQSFNKTSDGKFLFGSIGNNFTIQKKFNYRHYPKWIYVFGDSQYVNRINHIYEDSEKNIWIGSYKGLCKLSYQKGNADITKWEKTFFNKDNVLSSNITSIYEYKNKICFASSNGIASYNLENNLVTSFTNLFGYDLSSSTSIAIDKKERIWIGNMKGVYCYDGISIKSINSNLGLPSNEVLSLCYDKESNKLYIGTSNGFSILDIDLFENYYQPPLDIKIISVKAGDSLYTNFKNLVFQPEQHDVYIDFKAINFSSPRSIKYKYKLNEDKWIETENDFLNFISLKHGKYNLQIMAKIQNSDWSKPYSLAFTIMPRFVETIWFELLIISILVSVSVLIIINRLKLNNKKIRAELNLIETINNLKHQALSAMMNPHFIFNSLNSVQYLVNSNKNEEANDYIAMMAKLIRKNLETAKNGFILLSEEINRLRLYLDLEKLRFEEKFSYEITIDSDINTNVIMIPNMIIQPFVENSLWHGIINSGNKGLLAISFSFEDIDIDSVICKSLIIKVKDNGVGINDAKKKEDHISKGIQIVEERLRLLSTKFELPTPIIFEDLSSRSNNSHGTEVIISLPPPLYKFNV